MMVNHMPQIGWTQIITGLGAQAVQGIETENPVVNQYVRRIGQLMSHVSRWAAVSASGIRCSTTFKGYPCSEAAIAPCVVCNQPTCFDHSMISPRDGRIICFACVGKAERSWGIAPPSSHRGAPPPSQSRNVNTDTERRQHLKTLGLKEPVSIEDIKSAFRKLSVKYHPDKARTEAQKVKAEKKYKRITESYSWLIQNQRAA